MFPILSHQCNSTILILKYLGFLMSSWHFLCHNLGFYENGECQAQLLNVSNNSHGETNHCNNLSWLFKFNNFGTKQGHMWFHISDRILDSFDRNELLCTKSPSSHTQLSFNPPHAMNPANLYRVFTFLKSTELRLPFCCV